MNWVKGYYYQDSRGREVLHVQKAFVVIEPSYSEAEVVLTPNKLKTRFRGLRRVINNGVRDVREILVGERDVQAIIRLCFKGKEDIAGEYCRNLLGRVRNRFKEQEVYSSFDQERGYDPDGFDERFMGSLF